LFPTKEQLADPANDVTFEEGEVYTIEVWLTDAADGQVCLAIAASLCLSGSTI
jgi:hypothetical protein